jgi:predicted branched-subunit amino acid permease
MTVDPLTRSALLIALAVTTVGVAYGAMAASQGFPWWFAPMLGTAVLAASAEMLFLGLLAGGANPLLAFGAAALVNSRHLAYGMAVSDRLGRGPARLLRIHLVNDESVALALAVRDRDESRRALTVAGLGILAAWPSGALAGGLLGTVAPPEVLGLDALFPAVILALLVPALRTRLRTPLVAAMSIALVGATWAPAGLPPLLGLLALPLAMRRATR